VLAAEFPHRNLCNDYSGKLIREQLWWGGKKDGATRRCGEMTAEVSPDSVRRSYRGGRWSSWKRETITKSEKIRTIFGLEPGRQAVGVGPLPREKSNAERSRSPAWLLEGVSPTCIKVVCGGKQ